MAISVLTKTVFWDNNLSGITDGLHVTSLTSIFDVKQEGGLAAHYVSKHMNVNVRQVSLF